MSISSSALPLGQPFDLSNPGRATVSCPYWPATCLPVLLPSSVHMSSLPKLINAVVLLILLTALSDPEQYHLTSAELANDLDVMDDASK